MKRPIADMDPSLVSTDSAVPTRWAARRAIAATLHRLPERMLVDRAKGEAAAVRRSSERSFLGSDANASER